MKSKLGIMSNANALLVGFNLTHKDLLLAQSIAPEAFKVMDKEGKNELFSVMNAQNTSFNQAGVSFPFLNETETRKVEVLFIVEGTDAEIVNFNAAKVLGNIGIIEKQIKAALVAMRKTASSIETLEFGDKS